MLDESTPLIVVDRTVRARAGRARAAFVAIFVAICALHFWFEWGVSVGIAMSTSDFSEVSFNLTVCTTESDAHYDLELPRDIRVSNLLSPLVLIKHLDDRQCTHRFEGRRLMESGSLGFCERMSCGSSSATASSTAPAAPEYAVRPCRDGMYEMLTTGKGQLGPRPPKWPVPTESGLWYTSHYAACPRTASRTGDCWWRTRKAGMNAAKHPAGIECDRKVRATKDGKREGETATEARNRRDEAHGVTPTEARNRRDEAHGLTPAEASHQREVAYVAKHGHARLSQRSFAVGIDGVPFLQLEHIAKIKWRWDFTGSHGTVSPQDMVLRNRVVDQLYELMKPARPPNTGNGHALRTLLSHQAMCGHYMIADTEFHRPQSGSVDEDGVGLGVDDDDDDDANHLSTNSAYGRIYDISLPIADCRGNILERWARTSPNHGVAFSTTEGGRRILSEAIERLRAYRPEALRISWGSPELALFEMAGVRPMDRSNGIDVRQALLSAMPWCKPSGIIPFSTSQNLLVPFLGLRAAPLHTAEQDTIDEAVTMTALLDGLPRFYNRPTSPSAASSSTPSSAAATSAAATSAAASAAILSGPLKKAKASAAILSGPLKKAKTTGVKATTKAADAASSMKLTTLFAPKPNQAQPFVFPTDESWGEQFQDGA
jgi:hypothetical protein